MPYPYEILDYVVRLSFADAHGLDARVDTYEHIRVLAPELLAIEDRVWGDGDPVADYSSAPPVTRATRNGHRWQLTTVLSEALVRDDELEIHSIRHIHHGFKNDREWWELTPFVPTEHMKCTLTYPVAREPFGTRVSVSAATPRPFVSRPASKELLFIVDSPAVNSIYRVEWSW